MVISRGEDNKDLTARYVSADQPLDLGARTCGSFILQVKGVECESIIIEKGLLDTPANNNSNCATFGNGDPDDIHASSAWIWPRRRGSQYYESRLSIPGLNTQSLILHELQILYIVYCRFMIRIGPLLMCLALAR